MNLIIYIDGGALNNPGPAAIGVVFQDKQGNIIWKKSKTIGQATNNIAEYEALIYALQQAKRYKPKKVEVRSDSQLLVSQMTGKYKLKELEIIKLFIKAWNLLIDYQHRVKFTLIPREENQAADALVKQALGRGGLI